MQLRNSRIGNENIHIQDHKKKKKEYCKQNTKNKQKRQSELDEPKENKKLKTLNTKIDVNSKTRVEE